MGVNERKERERLELQKAILYAAKDLFVEQGYDKVSIRNIAEKIEYSPSTIYLYYKDKDEILFAVHELAFEILLKELSQTSVYTNPFERLKAMAEVYLQFAMNNQDLYDLMFIMREPMKAICGDDEWDKGFCSYNFLRDTIADCYEQGIFTQGSVEITTVSVFAHVHGLASLHIRGRFKMLPQEHIGEIIRESISLMLLLLTSKAAPA